MSHTLPSTIAVTALYTPMLPTYTNVATGGGGGGKRHFSRFLLVCPCTVLRMTHLNAVAGQEAACAQRPPPSHPRSPRLQPYPAGPAARGTCPSPVGCPGAGRRREASRAAGRAAARRRRRRRRQRPAGSREAASSASPPPLSSRRRLSSYPVDGAGANSPRRPKPA